MACVSGGTETVDVGEDVVVVGVDVACVVVVVVAMLFVLVPVYWLECSVSCWLRDCRRASSRSWSMCTSSPVG